ncbi:uncharacterized protein A4U43_C01F24830 [Asparagus officinalis]|uniref:Uncharacterized protein n=1 Tax=Asparagus officinalis TaxID=4686 RepID=A0A5P1FTQ7_ASPOF|nr:uncharacterized protein LOC109838183 [Asparagus officinalis]ONK81063.1 uncharacterized protein A4U43_C01F24830 [Asparagus officinalis]
MLLRSASTPILKSLIPAATTAKDSHNEVLITTEISTTKIPRIPSLKSLSSSSSPSPPPTNNRKSLRRATSDTSISEILMPPLPKPKQKPRQMVPPSISISSGEENSVAATSSQASMLVIDDEGCIGDGNCNSRGNGGHGKFSSDSNDDDRDADACYYRSMIQANPENSLVLSNYAKFLKEVRGDVARAEEYCRRAIVADQGDGNALSMYAEIVWERSRDAERAETYFDRAVQAAPDDCYVMASYARFLWEAEEEEDDDNDDDEEKENQSKNEMMKLKSMNQAPPFLSPCQPSIR